MKTHGKIGLIVALVAGMGAVVAAAGAEPTVRTGVPKLVDLGSKTCVRCKLMAPILDDMKRQYAGKMEVEFIEVSVRANLAKARQYKIRTIPTQVFLDANGKELWRHEGFISEFGIVNKFRELGYAFAADALKSKFARMAPAKVDNRAKASICFMCDGDLDANAAVVVKSEKGDVKLCGVHHFFVLYSCLTEDTKGFEKRVSVADFATGKMTPLAKATYLYGVDEKTGRPWVKAFAQRSVAIQAMRSAGGSLITYDALKRKELGSRCGFCDRAAHTEDAAAVKVGGIHTWGCCSHCALGVSARTLANIEVRQPDRLTGEMVTVKTLDGYIVSLEPKTAVAWLGMRKKADGSFGSAGCFHQGFFTSEDNLKEWVKQNPLAVGRMISINQALADKMSLSPQQIAKACKVGQCTPK